jgi:hypothetical protein
LVLQQAFAVASYGKQLGLITEVLLALAQQSPKASAAVKDSIAGLEHIRAEIERIKGAEHARVADTLAEQVRAIQRRGGSKARALNARLRPLLDDNRRA